MVTIKVELEVICALSFVAFVCATVWELRAAENMRDLGLTFQDHSRSTVTLKNKS